MMAARFQMPTPTGGEGPQVESKLGWDVDGVEVRVILDCGAGFIVGAAGTRTRVGDA
jgi:hypothetical protein